MIDPRLLLLLAFLPALHAAEFHVAISGDDSNPGTNSAPFRTLAAARDAARPFAGKEAVTVTVGDGVHYLPETLALKPADSGSAKFPVIYQAEHDGKAVISGGIDLTGGLAWLGPMGRPGGDQYEAKTPPGLVIDQLFVGGVRQRMARYPNYDATQTTAAWQGFAADAFSNERAAKWADPAGGYIHAMHAARWGGYHYRITGKNPDGSVAYEGGWQNNRQMGMHKDFRMVENIREELDASGEWFHDTKANILHFIFDGPFDSVTTRVEAVRLRHLVELQGSPGSPVKHVTFKGFVFRHSARTFMETKEPLLRSDWAIYRGGAVLLTGTEDVSIIDSEFDQPGGNAIFVNHYNRRSLIKGCHIHDAGASGVCFVGDPAAVRDPLFEYRQSQDLAKIDRTPGPKTDNYPADSVVENCLIHGIGRVERQPAGVQISMSANITVRDSSIYDCARAGINISEGTWGGHLIEGCDVFDTVLETHDHGSFNSWGRDRFWTSNHRGVSQPEVKKDPKLPFLDAVKPTVIRHSRWRCDHGWDIDLDDGSSNYEIHHNLLLAGGLKYREGYGRKAWNNVLVNNGFHPHVWFDDSGSEFRSNLVMAAHAPIGQPEGWGKQVDRNFFTVESDRTRHLNSGADANSLSGDPQFIDPAAGDFRVKDGSPVLKTGFENFPMDRFGVKKPALKAITKTPVIPELKAPGGQASNNSPAAPLHWLGASLHGLQGEEFSAFGTAKEDGGIQLVTVPEGSAAAKAGFKKNDLVQTINGRKITATADLFKALATLGDAPLTIKVIRNQSPLELKPANAPFTLVETADNAAGFTKLALPAAPAGKILTRSATNNDPPAVLTDGKLAGTYGPVFGNGTRDGAYKLDLGSNLPLAAITSWSFHQNSTRGPQTVSLFGSNATADPGWNTPDVTRFTPLGSLDTTALPAGKFNAASLRARPGQSLGTFRWIVWTTAPVTPAGENTAFQELAVEPAR
jgi:hypothetical protein